MKCWYMDSAGKVFLMNKEEYEEYMYYYGGSLVKLKSKPTKDEIKEERFHAFNPDTYKEKIGELQQWYIDNSIKKEFSFVKI